MNIETLYQSYSRDVFRFALYLSGNWEDAEDITAETFVRAWSPRIPSAYPQSKGIYSR